MSTVAAVRTPPQARVDRRIDPMLPAGPQIEALLRGRIIRAELRPGESLSEAAIAAECGVSRQPVRESFRRLADEGLLTIRPQRATRVRPISRAEALDARFVREAIEADIVRAVARDPSEELIDVLETSLKRQRAVPKRRPERFMSLDEDFHRTLALASGHEHAWRVVEGVKAQMDRVRFLALRRFPVPTLIAQHEAIVAAVRAGRPADAERAMRAHLREILADLPDIVAADPSMFDADASAARDDAAASPVPRKPDR